MNTKNIVNAVIACAVTLLLASCETREIETYASGRSLYFERWKQISSVERVRIDTVAYSFSDYVDKTELVHDFKINLTGDTLAQNTEYKVIVVDSLTTAVPEQYALPDPPVFHRGQQSDLYRVTIFKTPSLRGKEVYLTLRLVETPDFAPGYATYREVKIRFNYMDVKPAWWTAEIRDAYLGEYSRKKLETVIAANEGFTTLEGLSDTEKRKIALKTKAYIAERGITEEDGSSMVIPMY